jgi:hypothetical protein
VRRTFMSALTILFLTGCATVKLAIPAPKQAAFIKQQQAIDTALDLARMSWPEIGQDESEPSNIEAEEMSLTGALSKLNIQGGAPSGANAEQTVWLVSMDGLWDDLAVAPCQQGNCQTSHQPYHHCAIILDARTGLEIESSYRP